MSIESVTLFLLKQKKLLQKITRKQPMKLFYTFKKEEELFPTFESHTGITQ